MPRSMFIIVSTYGTMTCTYASYIATRLPRPASRFVRPSSCVQCNSLGNLEGLNAGMRLGQGSAAVLQL